MKFFVAFALCVAAASAFVIPAGVTAVEAAEIQQIIDAINHPSTDPATAAALEQMLLEVLGITKPEDVTPVVVDEAEILPIDVKPEIIDESIYSEPANYQRPPPLVQVIVNVNGNVAGNPVVVEQPSPAIVPEDIVVVEQPVVPEEVIVAPVIVPEPVIIAPIEPSPVVNLPEILN